MKIDAVVLAGSLNTGPLRECSPARNEALIPIGGHPMVEYVVKALQDLSQIDRVVIAGPVAELRFLYGNNPSVGLAESGATAIESLQNALKTLTQMSHGQVNGDPGVKQVLVATSDIPLITPEAIENFLQLCARRPGDLHYPVVPREANERKYPGVKRTYVKLKDGTFTGGNLFLVNPAIVERCAAIAQEIVRRRKNPVALSRLFGLGFVLKFLFRQLTLKEAEEKVSELLGIRGIAVISTYPEVGVDVDKPSDLRLAEKVLLTN
ncbi:MAG: NTP transferase domain-containing protein [Firmicutes bacterium]|nr:NTP transferase domain-containing protein [Bacillota bacterium]